VKKPEKMIEIKSSHDDVARAVRMYLNAGLIHDRDKVDVLRVNKTRATGYFLIALAE